MKASDIMLDLGKPIAYYPGLAKRWGPGAAAFFSQLFYWTGKQSDPEGWIYKTQDEIEDETGLGDEEQRTARKRLKSAGILEEKEARLEHRIYYRINIDNLNAIFPETGNPGLGESPLSTPLKGTTEITTENTESLSISEKTPEMEPIAEAENQPRKVVNNYDPDEPEIITRERKYSRKDERSYLHELEPKTNSERLLFGLVQAEIQATRGQYCRLPKRFPNNASRELFNKTVKRIGQDQITAAVNAALTTGILQLPKVIKYIAHWEPKRVYTKPMPKQTPPYEEA